MMEPSQILHEHQLKRTSCREGIIVTIMDAGMALSENEIREKLEGNYDRTTFYRAFKTLHDHQIIHKIVVDNQIVKYAIDNSVTKKNSHAHFYCQDCNTVQCMETVPVSIPQLPDGFTSSETEIIIKGRCNHCQNPE